MNENKNKPLASIKVGSIRAAIWKNQRQNRNGQEFQSVRVVLERSYVDRNRSYSSTNSLGVNDIPKAILVLTKAYEYLMEGHEENNERDEK